MLVTIACFCLFLAALVASVARREAKKDPIGQRIPPEPAKVAALVLLVIGAVLFGWSLYRRAFA